MVRPVQPPFGLGQPCCCSVEALETALSNSAPPINEIAGGGIRPVSTFTPAMPMLPGVCALEAVIPPTCVPLPLGPVTVRK